MSKQAINLPAYTTVKNIIDLIDVLKMKPKSEDEAKAKFGKGGSVYTPTKSALRIFGIIETDSLEFTSIGRIIAYSNDGSEKQEIFNIINGYEPYSGFLFNLMKKIVKETPIEEITNYWGRFGFGTTKRNTDEGATLFMNLLEYCGLGRFIKGKGEHPSRIEWESNYKQLIENYINNIVISAVENPVEVINTEAIDLLDFENDNKDSNEQVDIYKTVKSEATKVNILNKREKVSNVGGKENISLEIKVDMSTWSEEKIKIFFKYAYGNFED